MPDPVLRLADHVHACVDRDWLILLDLSHDRYHATSAAFADLIGRAPPRGPNADKANGAIGALLRAGLVEWREGEAPHEAHAPRPAPGRRGRISPRWFSLVRAALWADWIVRRGRLLAARTRIAALKRAFPPVRAASPGFANDARAAYEDFARSRLWIPRPYVCLFDSLCLVRFLIEARVGAELVIGVRARPFAAHAWVESAALVLDDGGEDCASYSTIARF